MLDVQREKQMQVPLGTISGQKLVSFFRPNKHHSPAIWAWAEISGSQKLIIFY